MSSIDPHVIQSVLDQIELWSAERQRITSVKGVLYDKFKSEEEFLLIQEYAKDLGKSCFSTLFTTLCSVNFISYFILHLSSFILPFIFHPSSFICHPSSFILYLHPPSFILQLFLSAFILQPSAFITFIIYLTAFLGVLLWENTEKQFLFVKEDAHPVMRDYIKSLK